MKIRHERPMSELAFRVRAPLRLELSDGSEVVVREWSLVGLRFADDVDILPVTGNLVIPFQGVEIKFPVRLKQDETSGEARFVDLTGRQRETLALFYRSILNGQMAATDQIITSLDTPVDLVPMGETEEEENDGKAKAVPRRLRAAFSLGIYALVAVLVFGLLGSQLWNRLNIIRLNSGYISAPISQYVAGQGAFVEEIRVTPGERVKAGQTLIVLSDPNRSADVEQIRSEIRLAKARLAEARIALEDFEARIEGKRRQLVRIYQQEQRKLRLRQFLGGYDLELVTMALRAIQTFDDDLTTYVGELGTELMRKQGLVEERDKQYRWLKRDLSNKKEAAAAVNIVATEDGTVGEIVVIKNQFVQRGETTLSLEAQEARVAVGWLSDRKADIVHVGMSATIRFNRGAGRQSANGTVIDIVSGVHPHSPDQFGMVVTVSIDHSGIDDTRFMFAPNAPVSLELDRNLLPDLF